MDGGTALRVAIAGAQTPSVQHSVVTLVVYGHNVPQTLKIHVVM